MADAMPLQPDRAAARAQLGLPPRAPLLAVLPGSRLGEIERLGEVFFEAAWHVSEAMPTLHVVVPAANARGRALIQAQLARAALPAVQTHVLDGQARTALAAADVVLLASGTATLEAMLSKRPMVVGYRISPLTYRIVRALGLIKVDRYALPNVLAGKDLAPELIQDDCTPERLAEAVLRWFQSPRAAAALQPEYLALHESLRRDASASAAEAIASLPVLATAGERAPP